MAMVSDGSVICNTFGYLSSPEPPSALHALDMRLRSQISIIAALCRNRREPVSG